MSFRTPFRAVVCLFTAAVFCCAFAQPGKRPINHRDYDSWRSIAGQQLSPDGRFLIYAVFPQEGDGEVIVRGLATGKESHHAAGERPAPAPAADAEEGPPQARNVTMAISADSRVLAFSAFAPRADVEKAKKDKKPAPKDSLVIVELASGKETRIERVRRFQMAEKNAALLVYSKEAPDAPAGAGAPAAAEPGDGDQQGGRGGRGGGGAGRGGARPEFGTEMVVRGLADGSEHSVPDVAEFILSDDGQDLVWAVAAHDAGKNGVFLARPALSGVGVSLLAGKGKYLKLAWDEKQTQAAFLSDRDDAAAKQPKWKIYRWERGGTAAAELVSGETPGFRKEFAISDKGTLGFSRDGLSVIFGVAPPGAAPAPAAAAGTADDKAVVDLWSYKDDYLQSMQKVTAARDRNRTFTAEYSIASHKVTQLGDSEVEQVALSDNPQWALGSDNRAYRRMNDYDEHYADAYLIDAATGARTLLLKKHHGTAALSPDGRYVLEFDGRDWSTIAVPGGKAVNLTANLPVKFFNEDLDTPSAPGAYGTGGWTKDGKAVLLYDKYDVWRMAPDGSSSADLTAGYGRAHELRLRVVRPDVDPHDRGIDPAKPLLLEGESLKTWETGFFRAGMEGGAPKKLVFAAKYYTAPVKAKNADVYLLSEQTFSEFPDLVITDGTFQEMRKVSNVNPQKEELLWGASELVAFKNADGAPLNAALYKPENFDPHKKYPMLVYIYEKLTDRLNHFVDPKPGHSINITYYVSNGYLVLTPDIVYTVGYPGQSALKCVLPAVQAVVDKGFVNENAIGIQGHSWGGYQIAYMITQTNRFRAAEAGAPVADMISAYDGIRWGTGITRQFQYEHTQSRIGGSIWQYPTRFIENSPIFWADRVQTPLMILQNDGDDAVPWYQGLEYFLALRRLGKEVYLFNYNGEPHHLNKRPNQKDYTIRMQEFFDHYLKGAPAPEWMEKGVPYLERDKTELSGMGR
jgi:dipeptidyl aminopeptidase/acylaminoacyl peptidase